MYYRISSRPCLFLYTTRINMLNVSSLHDLPYKICESPSPLFKLSNLNSRQVQRCNWRKYHGRKHGERTLGIPQDVDRSDLKQFLLAFLFVSIFFPVYRHSETSYGKSHLVRKVRKVYKRTLQGINRGDKTTTTVKESYRNTFFGQLKTSERTILRRLDKKEATLRYAGSRIMHPTNVWEDFGKNPSCRHN